MRKILLMLLFAGLAWASKAQSRAESQLQIPMDSQSKPPALALKANLLYGVGTHTPNLGLELGLSRRGTLHLGAVYNPWNLSGSQTDNKKLVHWVVRPEYRYWFGNRFSGHFTGVHGLYSDYNVGGRNVPLLFDKEFRYEGFAVGGGISYGYLWNWNHRWGLEFTLGMGAAYLKYDKYDCLKCGEKLGSFSNTYFGLTNAGITLLYKFGGNGKKSSSVPIYIPPTVGPAAKPNPVREPVAVLPAEQPEAATVPLIEPAATTAEKLAQRYPFIAPLSEFEAARKVASSGALFDYNMPLNMGRGKTPLQQNDVERFINNNREGSLSIHFHQGSTSVDRGFKENNSALVELVSAVRAIQESQDSRVVHIVIAGFASPEGQAAVNSRLAWERAVAIKEFLLRNTAVTGVSINIYNGGIDWRGLRRLVAESDMYEKYRIMDIIDNTPVWDAQRNIGRHGELMRLEAGVPYRQMMHTMFSELRNAAYIRVYYENK